MSTNVTRKVPPQRLINLINPVVRGILVSPLHPILDKALLVLHVVGRRSGRQYRIPVGYLDLDAAKLVVTQHSWRANLRGVSEVRVTLRGRRQPMHIDLQEDPEGVAGVLQGAVQRLGWPAARRQLGLKTPGSRIPTQEELADAAREYHLSTLLLTTGERPASSQ
jgi:F420H(2)-dependent quinone reductase